MSCCRTSENSSCTSSSNHLLGSDHPDVDDSARRPISLPRFGNVYNIPSSDDFSTDVFFKVRNLKKRWEKHDLNVALYYSLYIEMELGDQQLPGFSFGFKQKVKRNRTYLVKAIIKHFSYM